MAWELVPALQEFRTQINEVAPNRDRASDGVIGDYNHQKGDSSHNPDDTGRNNSEWDTDPDGKEEVRAIDIDIDFRQSGITADRLVEHLIKYAKNGTFWWLRYIIYNRKIYSKSTGWAERDYFGSNPHDKHIHINNDFTQSADNKSGCDYRLEELLPVPEDTMAKEDVANYFDDVRQAVQGDGADATDRNWREDLAAAIRYGLGYNGVDQAADGFQSQLPPAKFAEILTALTAVNARLTAIEAKLNSGTTKK
jgi:hypothetical protein